MKVHEKGTIQTPSSPSSHTRKIHQGTGSFNFDGNAHNKSSLSPKSIKSRSNHVANSKSSYSPKHIDTSHVPKNEKGGVLISEDEIRAMFSVLDEDKTGKINLTTLRKKIGILFTDLSLKDYKFLMNDQRYLTVDDLINILIDNEITNFDPTAEAFQCYDPSANGYVDKTRLKEIFKSFGYGEISDEEFDVLVRIADGDGDGKLSIDDFRSLCDGVRPLRRVLQKRDSEIKKS